jgi:hypothetical protein
VTQPEARIWVERSDTYHGIAPKLMAALGESPCSEIELKAWLSTFDVVHELYQAIHVSVFVRRWRRGSRKGARRQEVLQATEQCSFLLTSGHNGQTTFWPIASEVFKEPAVMQTIASGSAGGFQKDIVDDTFVGLERAFVRTAVAVDGRECEFRELHLMPD